MKSGLFSGDPSGFGGLSNERDLAKSCPQKFRDRNEWSEYASRIFFSGASTKEWKCKTSNDEEKRKQMACFRALLSGFGLSHEDKEAVAGWMLSEMLTEVPKWKAA